MKHLTVRNGLTLAYTIAFVNATLALVEAFGVMLTHVQELSITAFVNAAVLLSARVLHLPEQTANGTIAVEHVPVLVEKPAELPAEPAPEAPPVTAT